MCLQCQENHCEVLKAHQFINALSIFLIRNSCQFELLLWDPTINTSTDKSGFCEQFQCICINLHRCKPTNGQILIKFGIYQYLLMSKIYIFINCFNSKIVDAIRNTMMKTTLPKYNDLNVIKKLFGNHTGQFSTQLKMGESVRYSFGTLY